MQSCARATTNAVVCDGICTAAAAAHIYTSLGESCSVSDHRVQQQQRPFTATRIKSSNKIIRCFSGQQKSFGKALHATPWNLILSRLVVITKAWGGGDRSSFFHAKAAVEDWAIERDDVAEKVHWHVKFIWSSLSFSCEMTTYSQKKAGYWGHDMIWFH